jgi:hypothetical protein
LLADYVGGALEGTSNHDRVAHLIATDPAWRGAAEQLTAALHATSFDLDRLRRTPEPMPADVVERISAALNPAPPRPVRSKPFIHKLRWAVPIAVAAAAIGFVAIKIPVGGNLAQDTSAPAAKRAPEIGADSAGAGEVPVPTITSGAQHNRSNLRESSGRMNSDNAATPAPKAASPQSVYGAAPPVPSGLERLSDRHALHACLDAVAMVLPGQPTLVDYSYFEGRPALVISITTPSGKWSLVAGPDCGVIGADEIYRTPLQ